MKDSTNSLILNRYRLIEKLGESHNSIVFKAMDEQHHSLLAMKKFQTPIADLSVEDLLMHRKHANKLHLLSHEGIVRVFDFLEDENWCYLTMEMLEGESLFALLKRETKRTVKEACQIILSMLPALEYAHGQGVLHRDLKPSNLMVNFVGELITVKLIDFGFLTEETVSADYEGAIIGTFGYMSPEAMGLTNQPPDERSDLYSIGAIFYEMIAGRLPFEADSTNKLIQLHAASLPTPFSVYGLDIPEVVEKMVRKLLEKDPDLRYQTVRGLWNDLKRYESGESGFELGFWDVPKRIQLKTRQIGREFEMTKLKELVDRAANGSGSFCLIKGEPGIGKSRLAQELRTHIAENDGLFISGGFSDLSVKTPFQAFVQALNEYLIYFQKQNRKWREVEKQRLLEQHGSMNSVLLQVNPRLREILGAPNELASIPADRENKRLMMVSAEFVTNLVPIGTAGVLFLDDLQWADEGSLALIAEMINRITSSRLVIIAACRDEKSISEWKTQCQKELFDETCGVFEMTLQPFSEQDVRLLLQSIFPQGGSKIESYTNQIFLRSHGNPMFAKYIVKMMYDRGAIPVEGDQWTRKLDFLESVEIPKDLLESMVRRIELLSDQEIELLQAIATIGRIAEKELILKIASVNPAELEEMSVILREQDILYDQPDPNVIAFTHDRLREAVIMTIDESHKQKLHDRLSVVLRAKYEAGALDVIYRLAYHSREAGRTGDAAQYFEIAGDVAVEALAYSDAVKYYEIAHELGKEFCGEDTVLQTKRMDMKLLTGDSDGAIRLIDALLEGQNDSLQRAILHRKMASAFFKKGDMIQSEVSFLKALSILGIKAPSDQNIQMEVFWAFGKSLILHALYRPEKRKKPRSMTAKETEIVTIYSAMSFLYIFRDMQKNAYHTLHLYNWMIRRAGKSKELAMALSSYSTVFFHLKKVKKSQRLQEASLAMSQAVGDRMGEAHSLHYLGRSFAWQGDRARAITCFEKSISILKTIGNSWGLGFSLDGLGAAYCHLSKYEESMKTYQTYLDISRRLEDSHGITLALLQMSQCCIESGEFERAALLLEEGIQLATKNDSQMVRCCLYVAKGTLLYELGDYTHARECLDLADQLYQAHQLFKGYTLYLYPILTETIIKNCESVSERTVGLIAEDTILLKKTMSLARKETKGYANYLPTAYRSIANAYAFLGEDRKAERYFCESIRFARASGRRFEEGKNLYHHAIYLFQKKNPEYANQQLRRAYELFDEIGAKVYRERCLDALKRTKNSGLGESEKRTMKQFAQERKMKTIMNIARDLCGIFESGVLLSKIIDSAMEITGAQRGALLVKDQHGDLTVMLTRDATKNAIDVEEHRWISRRILKMVEEDHHAVIIDDASNDESYRKQSSVLVSALRSVACIPILTKGTLRAVIYLDNSLIKGLFAQDDLDVVFALAGQASICIENAELYRDLESKVQERTQELKQKNELLEELVNQLEDYSNKIEEFSVAQERNRIASEVHDSIGHTLTVLIKMLEFGQLAKEDQPIQLDNVLKESIQVARDGLQELKRSIRGMLPERLEGQSLTRAIGALLTEYETMGIESEYYIENLEESYHNKRLSLLLYNACKESLTNAMKHGNATHVTVILKRVDPSIHLTVIDNGCGCKVINKGFGLSGMEERVKRMGGTLQCHSDGENGFILEISVPETENET